MCGLVGVASTSNITAAQKKAFGNLLIIDQIRGVHSTGLFSVDSAEKVNVHKRSVDANTFLDMKTYEKAMAPVNLRILAGHNRFATKGSINHANAHPFIQGSVVMMHNGTLKTMNGLREHEKFDTDSEAIAYNLSLVQPDQATTVLEKLNGAYALVWYDGRDDTLNFARNDERSLYYATDDKHLHGSKYMSWASEYDMISLANERNHQGLSSYHPIKELHHHKIDVTGKFFRLVSSVPFKEFTPITYSNNWSKKQSKKQIGHKRSSVGESTYTGKQTQHPSVSDVFMQNVPDYFPTAGSCINLEPVVWEEYRHNPGVGKGIFLHECADKEIITCIKHQQKKEEFDALLEDLEKMGVRGSVLNRSWSEIEGEYVATLTSVYQVSRKSPKAPENEIKRKIIHLPNKQGKLDDETKQQLETSMQKAMSEATRAAAEESKREVTEEKKSSKECQKSQEGQTDHSGLLRDSMGFPYIEGPNKRMLTHKEYYQYVKHGCAECSCDITPDDSPDIEWLEGNNPLCLRCSTERAYEDSITKKGL